MALYVLGDTHLSLGASKPMDVFPGWNGYVERLARTSHKQLAALLHILHTQNPACVCEISVIFFVFRYTLGLPQAPGLAGGPDYV